MGEELLDFGLVKDQMQGIIKVVGVGGGGCNAVRNMYNEGVEGVTYAVCNTDSQSLSRSPVPVKIQLGSLCEAVLGWYEDGFRDSWYGWWYWYWCCACGGWCGQG